MDLSCIFCLFTILSVILIVGLLGLLGLEMMRRRNKLGRRFLLLLVHFRQMSRLRRRMSNVSRCFASMLRQCWLWWTDSHRQSASSC